MLTTLRSTIATLRPRQQFALAVLLVVDALLWLTLGLVLAVALCR